MITCITSFYFGMETNRFNSFFLIKKKILITSIILLITLCTIKINSFIFIFQIQGFSLFIVLFQIGKCIKSEKLNLFFNEISKHSYSIYLFHHRIILEILSLNNPTKWYIHLSLLFITFLLTIICSKIHLMVVNSIIKSITFKKFEKLFV